MVHPSQRRPRYSSRKPAFTLTWRRGEVTRSYPVRPWVAGSAVGFFGLLLVAYVAATAYLIYRDDLLGAAVSRQVSMQYAYEERIAALRAELDRLSSRHAVQTEGVEEQLAALLDQQATIEERQSALDVLVGQARAAGVALASDAARAAAEGGEVPPLGYAPTPAPTDGDTLSGIILKDAHDGTSIRPILARVGASLDRADALQEDALDALSVAAGGEEQRLIDALSAIGANVGGPEEAEAEPQGGPFVPTEGLHFVERVALLENTLGDIATLRSDAAVLPVRVPVKALYFSSGFGNRIDPFLKRPAFHAGLDFVAEAGTVVYATAPGRVISAGRNGGYGEMVEIAHADGITTRYAHLSRALVKRGMEIDAGTPIGRVGSTGRSTGPHLHYETRRDGEPIDPALYLAAGKALRGY
jgi:murein DD-endopeptidase MepM/ murein hydrolase activator NlpD